jgi:hypothetical protein
MKKFILLFLALIFIPLNTFALEANTEILLKNLVFNEEKVSFDIFVKNPSQQKISSVQTWLKYDTEILEGEKIKTEESDFSLVAPGENQFDKKNGLVKIGRSIPQTGKTDEELFVANLVFNRLNEQETKIDFYNYSSGNDSYVSVRSFQDGVPVNILAGKPDALKIEGEKSVNNTNYSKEIDFSEKDTENLVDNNEVLEKTIDYPRNLRGKTGPNYVFLKWEAVNNVDTYYLYYSQNSGHYIKKRKIGKEPEYYLEDLENNTNYYFAVTAFKDGKESEYSQELAVKVGVKGSESNYLENLTENTVISNPKKHVNSGPSLIIWNLIIFSLLATWRLKKYL